jgi:hypothetical protein
MPTVFAAFGTPKPQFFDSNGDPLSGGKLYTYAPGTTTPKTTYTGADGATPNANPLVLNSRGEPANQVWAETGGLKLVLNTAADSTIWTADNWALQNDVAIAATSEWVASGLTPTYIGATQFSVAADQTAIFHVGRALRIVDAGGTDYGVVSAVSFGAGITTVTVAFDSGSLDSGVSAVSYSIISASNSSRPVLRGDRAHIADAADPTKMMRFDAGGITTASTRVTHLPDADVSAALYGGALRGHIGGLTLANNSGDATNDIDISAGEATDNGVAVCMQLSSAITKRSDAGWTVGTGNGWLDTGTIGNNWYHVFLIRRPDTGVVDSLLSLSATSPTMPTSYTQKRRIGSILRSGGAIVAFSQVGEDFLWIDPPLDVNANNPGTSAVTRTLSVPTGVKVIAHMNVRTGGDTTSRFVYISSLDVNDEAPSGTAAPLATFGIGALGSGVAEAGFASVRTDTSGQVRTRIEASSVNVDLRIATLGWTDSRGRWD